jgi:ABC-type transport system substrate-binding protein
MNVYETLYGFDENVVPMPILAEGVTISDDGLTYVFTLRKGVKFHNGDDHEGHRRQGVAGTLSPVGATPNLEPIEKVDGRPATMKSRSR